MTYEDWVTYYDQIQICNISPDTMKSSRPSGPQGYRWNCIQFDGEWVNGRSSGGAGQGHDKSKYWINVRILDLIKD